MSRTLVIAEPGCTHEGHFDLMVQLIQAAADAGADVFKAQWTSDARLMCVRRNAPEYLKFYRWLQFPVEWHADLRRVCEENGLQYACSVYLPQDVATLAPLVEYLKVSSFEAEDALLLYTVAQQFRGKVLVSAGMGAQCQATWDVRWLVERLDVLHCVSAYPAPLEAMNLRRLEVKVTGGGACGPSTLQRRYAGLSDHSRHLLTGALAVACGATIIETHYRLEDCDPQNPDYPVAFTPDEFAQYIRNIRDAETMLGDGVKQVQPCEEPMLRYKVQP